MAIDTPDPPWALIPKQQDNNDDYDSDARTAWLAGLYRLHGPPGLSASPMPPACPAAPFVSPRTAPFPVQISARDLSALLRGCGPNVPACPWQDIYEGGGAYDDPDGLADVPERKWAFYAEEQGRAVKVHMHRSWTGIKLIELTIDAPSPGHPPDDVPTLEDDGTPGMNNKEGRTGVDKGPRITHITFETHEDYKLKGADERLYKHVAREVCWWAIGICLGPETGT